MIKFLKSTPNYRKVDELDPKKTRRPYDEVLGRQTGASPRGSTYWKRVNRCPRELALFEGGLRRANPLGDPIIVGLLYHMALEAYYKSLQAGATGDESEQRAWQSLAPFRGEPGYEECFEIIERMIAGYFERWRENDTRNWDVLAVEETVEFVDPETIEWSGRFDALIRRRDTGSVWLVEHKSAGRITQDLIDGYQMDLQIPGYSWLARKVVDFSTLGPYVGCIVNLATREKSPSFERVEVCPSKQHMAEFEMSMKANLTMQKTFGALGHPKRYGNCIGAPRYFSRCDYFDVCLGRPEASAEQLLSEEAPHGFVNTNFTGPVSTIDPDEAA